MLFAGNKNETWLAQIRARQLFKIGDTAMNGYLTENDFYFVAAELFPSSGKGYEPSMLEWSNFQRIFTKVPINHLDGINFDLVSYASFFIFSVSIFLSSPTYLYLFYLF
jgi:hypothetical protein